MVENCTEGTIDIEDIEDDDGNERELPFDIGVFETHFNMIVMNNDYGELERKILRLVTPTFKIVDGIVVSLTTATTTTDANAGN